MKRRQHILIFTILAISLCFSPLVHKAQAQNDFTIYSAVTNVHHYDGNMYTYFYVDIGTDFPGAVPGEIDTITITGPSGDLPYSKDDFEYLSQWREFFLSVPGSPELGDYTFSVTGNGLTSVGTDTQNVIRTIPAPDSSSMSPSFGEAVSTTTPTFSWPAVDYSETTVYYRLDVNDSTGYRVHSTSRVEGMTSYTIPDGILNQGETYYYRVRVTDSADWVETQNRANSPWIDFQVAGPGGYLLGYGYVQRRKYEDGRDFNRLLFELMAGGSYVQQDVIEGATLFDPNGNPVSLSNLRFASEYDLYGSYASGQWQYDPGFSFWSGYVAEIDAGLVQGTYDLEVSVAEGTLTGGSTFNGLVDMPIISAGSIQENLDGEGNLSLSWDEPAISGDTSIRAIIDIYNNGSFYGEVYVRVPTGVGYLYLPNNVLDLIVSKGDRFEFLVQLRTNDNNNRTYSDKVTLTSIGEGPSDNPPDPPTLTSPADGTTGVPVTPTLQTGVFSDPDSGDTHSRTDWQVSTDSGFSTLVVDVSSSNSLTSYPVPQSVLQTGTTYYWRARFTDSQGNLSDWSQSWSFVTSSPPNPPVLSSPLDGATDVSLTPTLQTESFSDPDGDSHFQSEWQIGTDTEFQFPTLHQTSSTALTSLPVAEGVLGAETIYYWRVRFYDNKNGVSGWSQVSSFTTLSIVANQPPARPVLSFPADGAIDVSLTPRLQTTGFSDPDSGDTHLWTEYQVSSEADFSSPVLRIQRTVYNLTSLRVPELVLVARTTYYWRVRFFDNHSNGSEWSEVFSFTTEAAINDQNDDGIPDSQENDTVDLNNDGTPDSEQEEIKSLNTVVGEGQMGVSREESPNVTSIDSIDSRDPEEISEEVRPHSMPLGLFALRVTVATPGDTARVTVYLSEAAPANARWYKYDSITGWEDYSEYASFSSGRMSVVLELKDGGHGDSDGLANGVIVDPGGFGLASWIKGMVYDSATGQPLANAEVRISDTVLSTDLDGNYVSMYLPGTYTVTTTASGYDPQSLPGIVINEGGITEQDIGLSVEGSGEGPETGYLIDFQTKDQDLWIRAVIDTEEKGPIEAVWRLGGQSPTSRGDEVVWGHFYASPSDVTWGSMNNPDLYVKIWFDVGGRLDVNFFHVSVPDIVVYSDYAYDGTPDEQGTTSMSTRYIRQYYQNGESHSEEQTEDGSPPAGASPSGNPTSYGTMNSLNIGAMINTEELGLIDAVWQLGGEDSTTRGDQVVWGHFYASPSDVSWGSAANPDLFVKIWFDAGGRIDVNFFHVSVPDIEVYSDYPGDGTYDQAGTTLMSNRYIRQEYQR